MSKKCEACETEHVPLEKHEIDNKFVSLCEICAAQNIMHFKYVDNIFFTMIGISLVGNSLKKEIQKLDYKLDMILRAINKE